MFHHSNSNHKLTVTVTQTMRSNQAKMKEDEVCSCHDTATDQGGLPSPVDFQKLDREGRTLPQSFRRKRDSAQAYIVDFYHPATSKYSLALSRHFVSSVTVA